MLGNWWQRLRFSKPPSDQRWVMIDVETTGLDPRRDALLCVAAMAIDLRGPAPQLWAHDSFEVVIRQEALRASHDNILLHGIGWGQQRAGKPLAEALQALDHWVADAPLLAYHAAFDQAVLQAAFRQCRRPPPAWQWLDLADLLPAAYPSVEARSLDQWMEQLGVHCERRHQAIADVWATAQLFLKGWPQWQALHLRSWHDLTRRARQERWLRVSQSTSKG